VGPAGEYELIAHNGRVSRLWVLRWGLIAINLIAVTLAPLTEHRAAGRSWFETPSAEASCEVAPRSPEELAAIADDLVFEDPYDQTETLLKNEEPARLVALPIPHGSGSLEPSVLVQVRFDEVVIDGVEWVDLNSDLQDFSRAGRSTLPSQQALDKASHLLREWSACTQLGDRARAYSLFTDNGIRWLLYPQDQMEATLSPAYWLRSPVAIPTEDSYHLAIIEARILNDGHLVLAVTRADYKNPVHPYVPVSLWFLTPVDDTWRIDGIVGGAYANFGLYYSLRDTPIIVP
jgi:hypothetical protein